MGDNCHKRGWWTKYSESRLADIECKILSVVKSTFRTWFVPIGSVVGQDDRIWTIAFNEESKNTPLVMLHGFAAAIGFWCKNFDEIAQDRPVYAIDLLGFGRSSRPKFASDCEFAESQWVNALEEWRKEVKLEKFILLGHSFGGYLATSYTMKYPERVKHLILADPWGFQERPADYKPPTYFRVLAFFLRPLFYFNPLSTVRGAGPLGPSLVRKMRSDIAERYGDRFENTQIITDYIYQCNSQYPSGETAFHSFVEGFAWSKNPMIRRFDFIDPRVPISCVYGENSWIDPTPGLVLQEKREQTSYVNIALIPQAGHHLYSDQPDIFNKFIRETCKLCDTNNYDQPPLDSVRLVKNQLDRDRLKEFLMQRGNKHLDPRKKYPIDEVEGSKSGGEPQEVTAK